MISVTNADQMVGAMLMDTLLAKTDADVNGNAMHGEVIGWTGVIEDATQILVQEGSRKLNYCHMIAEALFNLTTPEIAIMQRYNKKITRFVSDQVEITQHQARWAYHPWLRQGLNHCCVELTKDINTRRASFHIPYNGYGFDGTPPCLSGMQFLVREGKLNAIITMRSNDAWLGAPLDIFQFGLMQHIVAASLDLPVGFYQHNVGSLHLYKRDYEKAGEFAANAVPENGVPFSIDSDAMEQLMSRKLHFWVTELAANRDRNVGYIKSGFGPLLNVLLGDVTHMHPSFSEVFADGKGIGWPI